MANKNIRVWANKNGTESVTTFMLEVNRGDHIGLMIGNYMMKEWDIHPSDFVRVTIDDSWEIEGFNF